MDSTREELDSYDDCHYCEEEFEEGELSIDYELQYELMHDNNT
jgi:hypothetical protein